MAKSNNNSAKDAIKAYLDKRAAEDELFAVAYAKENKNIDDCFRYILNVASKRGNSVCMTDEEVFGLAVHYYDEDDIKVESLPKGTEVRTATSDDLTEEEKAKIREEAKEKYQSYVLEQMRKELDEKTRKAAQARKEAIMKAKESEMTLF